MVWPVWGKCPAEGKTKLKIILLAGKRGTFQDGPW